MSLRSEIKERNTHFTLSTLIKSTTIKIKTYVPAIFTLEARVKIAHCRQFTNHINNERSFERMSEEPY